MRRNVLNLMFRVLGRMSLFPLWHAATEPSAAGGPRPAEAPEAGVRNGTRSAPPLMGIGRNPDDDRSARRSQRTIPGHVPRRSVHAWTPTAQVRILGPSAQGLRGISAAATAAARASQGQGSPTNSGNRIWAFPRLSEWAALEYVEHSHTGRPWDQAILLPILADGAGPGIGRVFRHVGDVEAVGASRNRK